MDVDKILDNYCQNLNRIVLYMKGRQTDLQNIEMLTVPEHMLKGSTSEININLSLLRNVERIKGSEILADIKNTVNEQIFDKSTFNKSLMRESLKSNVFRKDPAELLAELQNLQEIHERESAPMEKFIDLIQGKMQPSQSTKRKLGLDPNKDSGVEDSIELLLIKRVTALEKLMPKENRKMLQQMNHTLGTLMIDYLSKIEQLDSMVEVNKEQNESLKSKLDENMRELRSKRRADELQLSRYRHLTDLMQRQKDMFEKQIKNLQSKLEKTRMMIHTGPVLPEEYEIVSSSDQKTVTHETTPTKISAIGGEEGGHLFESMVINQDQTGNSYSTPIKDKSDMSTSVQGSKQVQVTTTTRTQTENEGSTTQQGSSKTTKTTVEQAYYTKKPETSLPMQISSKVPLQKQPQPATIEAGSPQQVATTSPSNLPKISSADQQPHDLSPQQLTHISLAPGVTLPSNPLDKFTQGESQLPAGFFIKGKQTQGSGQQRGSPTSSRLLEEPLPALGAPLDLAQHKIVEAPKAILAESGIGSSFDGPHYIVPQPIIDHLRKSELDKHKWAHYLQNLTAKHNILSVEHSQAQEQIGKHREAYEKLIQLYNVVLEKRNKKSKSIIPPACPQNFHEHYEQLLKEHDELRNKEEGTLTKLQDETLSLKTQLSDAKRSLTGLEQQIAIKNAELRTLYEKTVGDTSNKSATPRRPAQEGSNSPLTSPSRTNASDQQSATPTANEQQKENPTLPIPSTPTQAQGPEQPEAQNPSQVSNIDNQTFVYLNRRIVQLQSDNARLEHELDKYRVKDYTLESIMNDLNDASKVREVPFIYIKGKKTTGDEIFNLLEQYEKQLLEKKAIINDLQNKLAYYEGSPVSRPNQIQGNNMAIDTPRDDQTGRSASSASPQQGLTTPNPTPMNQRNYTPRDGNQLGQTDPPQKPTLQSKKSMETVEYYYYPNNSGTDQSEQVQGGVINSIQNQRQDTPRDQTPRDQTPRDPRDQTLRDPRDPTPRDQTPRDQTPRDPTPRDVRVQTPVNQTPRTPNQVQTQDQQVPFPYGTPTQGYPQSQSPANSQRTQTTQQQLRTPDSTPLVNSSPLTLNQGDNSPVQSDYPSPYNTTAGGATPFNYRQGDVSQVGQTPRDFTITPKVVGIQYQGEQGAQRTPESSVREGQREGWIGQESSNPAPGSPGYKGTPANVLTPQPSTEKGQISPGNPRTNEQIAEFNESAVIDQQSPGQAREVLTLPVGSPENSTPNYPRGQPQQVQQGFITPGTQVYQMQSQVQDLARREETLRSENEQLLSQYRLAAGNADQLSKEYSRIVEELKVVKIELEIANQRIRDQMDINNELQKDIVGVRTVNSQLVVPIPPPIKSPDKRSPSNKSTPADFDLSDEDTMDELVSKVGRENEEMKEKIRQLEVQNKNLVQQLALGTANTQGQEKKIAELNAEILNRESQIKNLQHYSKTISSQSPSDALTSPEKPAVRKRNFEVQVEIFEDLKPAVDHLRKELEEKNNELLGVHAEHEELKEHFALNEKALREVRQTLASIYQKKQYLMNLLLSFDDDIYIGGKPLKRLDEETLDSLLAQAAEVTRDTSQVRNSLAIPTKSSISMLNIKPPTLDELRSVNPETHTINPEVAKLTQQVTALGSENRSLKQAIDKYVTREEDFKGHILQLIESNSKINPDQAETYKEFKHKISVVDDEHNELIVPINYSELIAFIDYLNNHQGQGVDLRSIQKDPNYEAYIYQNHPDTSQEDDLLVKLLEKNQQFQSEIQRLPS